MAEITPKPQPRCQPICISGNVPVCVYSSGHCDKRSNAKPSLCLFRQARLTQAVEDLAEIGQIGEMILDLADGRTRLHFLQ